MNEREPTPETTPATVVDHRRLDVAARRFSGRIAEGVDTALREQHEIEPDVARMIAHVLGRALGPASALATFGRDGTGSYETLREEYLSLYNDPQVSDEVKWCIDWLGTHLLQRDKTGSGRQFQNEYLPPQLDRVLYRDQVDVNGESFVVHIPGTTTRGDAGELAGLLGELQISQDVALQAFLTLPDVNALTDNLMESFHEAFAGTYANEEAALRALSPLAEWESELADWCVDNGIEPEAVTWNLTPLMERLRGIYDLVEKGGRLHAFVK